MTTNTANTDAVTTTGFGTFAPGRPFPSRHSNGVKDYLDTALRGERFVAAHQHEDTDGVFWTGPDNDENNLSLYNGDAGVTFLYLELARVTGENRFADIARRASHRLALHWRTIIDHITYPFIDHLEFGLHEGVAGVGSVLIIAYPITTPSRCRRCATSTTTLRRRHVMTLTGPSGATAAH